MKKFGGLKPQEQICREAEDTGWEVDKTEFEDGGDGIWLRDMERRMLQVRFNSVTGRFAVWNPVCGEKPVATERSSNFDGCEWYDEILNLLYFPA